MIILTARWSGSRGVMGRLGTILTSVGRFRSFFCFVLSQFLITACMNNCKMFHVTDFVPFPRGLVPHLSGVSLVSAFSVSGLLQVLVVITNSCNLQGYRLCY